jgi:DNA polymerase III subunit epsilon
VLAVDLLNHYRHISQQPLTVIDVETTGSAPYNARVIEISLLQANLADGILHQQTTLVNPQVWVPPQITDITGITSAMVKTAPMSTKVWPQYYAPLSEGILTAHNLSFDYGFVQMELAKLGLSYTCPEQRQFCTVKLSRLLYPTWLIICNYQLQNPIELRRILLPAGCWLNTCSRVYKTIAMMNC